MGRVTFVSSNKNKYLEARRILQEAGIEVEFAQAQVPEIQSDSLEKIAEEKARTAFRLVGLPAVVEDDGLFIDSLKGFPGPYSSFVFETIGNEGILKLLGSITADADRGRCASFRSIVAYFDGRRLHLSRGVVEGRISWDIAKGGWGYDPIFAPNGSDLTFAELAKEKDRFSHRRIGLEKFAEWLLRSKV